MRNGYESILREFVSKSSDEELRFLGMRLTERLQDDLAEVLEHVGKSNNRNVAIDNLLRSAEGAIDIYDYCDALRGFVVKEAESRRVSLARGKP